MVRRGPSRRIDWQANEAALLWAREHDIDDTELDRLATDVGQLGDEHADGAVGSTASRNGELRWHAVPWDDGWLAWCLPQRTFVPTSQQKLDRFDILRASGRVGMIVGDGVNGGQWDDNAYQLWGFAPNSARPTLRDMLERVHPEDRERLVALLHTRSRSTGFGNDRFRLRLPNGDVRHLHMMLNVARDDAGRPAHVTGVIIDDSATIERYLAQRKVAEDALNALELAGVGVWRQSLVTGKIVGDTVFHERMRAPQAPDGLDHEWVMAQHHPDDQQSVREANTRALQSNEAVDAVVRVRGTDHHGDRTLFTRRVTRRDACARPMELVGVSMDISALVRDNEQAQAWARRAELAATAAGIGFWYLDPATGEGEWDPTLFKLHGRDARQATPDWSHWVDQFVVAADRQLLLHAFPRDERQSLFQRRCRIRRTDGATRWIEVTVQPETERAHSRWIAMVTDVTERRLAEIRHRRDEIALADARAREQVMAKLGWQLRTSLNTMFGFSELAADAPDVPPQARRWLAQVRTAGSDLLRQLEHLGGDPAPSSPEPAAAAPPAVPQSLATARDHPLSVVYIEDNALNLLLVETMLAPRHDVVLHSATDGRTGIDAVRRLHPDLVLIDMQLPDLDGYQVLRHIRNDEALASSLCVVLSADNAREEIRRALAAGFDDYWTKPIDIPRFLGAIDALAHGQPLPGAALSH